MVKWGESGGGPLRGRDWSMVDEWVAESSAPVTRRGDEGTTMREGFRIVNKISGIQHRACLSSGELMQYYRGLWVNQILSIDGLGGIGGGGS